MTQELERIKDAYQWGKENDLFNLDIENVEWLIEQAEKAQRYEEALNQIIAWGPVGGSYSDISAAQTFQGIARTALEGKS